MTITVGIVDDDAIVRRALLSQLSAEQGIDVLFACADGLQAVAEVRRTGPDLVLMDVRMPDLDGISATASIKLSAPRTKVLLITALDNDGDVTAALSAGATGFLLKSSPPDVIANAIRAVHHGTTVLSPGLLARLRGSDTGPADLVATRVDPLTPREQEILQLLCQASTNAEIADRMSLAESTVKTHVSAILAKLGVQTRLKAVVRAYELGLTGGRTDEPS
ncbi:MAG: response regulator transcription factor [Propionicimonas sp.]|uniref:response regulator transcription factor n=1 Tax=Propionicimonas sp. TaxID=1955623 RepID=UPI002B204184|nr:response regulator transcription factor [Propionicimonas sp.]MEA4944607.1 response regulator transcription factor [Propionicimonas sp.]